MPADRDKQYEWGFVLFPPILFQSFVFRSNTHTSLTHHITHTSLTHHITHTSLTHHSHTHTHTHARLPVLCFFFILLLLLLLLLLHIHTYILPTISASEHQVRILAISNCVSVAKTLTEQETQTLLVRVPFSNPVFFFLLLLFSYEILFIL